MPRLSRTVFAGVPHHVTQRGNRREDIFFSDEDRAAYLSWLKEYSEKFGVEILAYCLMTNHIHLVAVPATDDGLFGFSSRCTCVTPSASTLTGLEGASVARAVLLVASG